MVNNVLASEGWVRGILILAAFLTDWLRVGFFRFYPILGIEFIGNESHIEYLGWFHSLTHFDTASNVRPPCHLFATIEIMLISATIQSRGNLFGIYPTLRAKTSPPHPAPKKAALFHICPTVDRSEDDLELCCISCVLLIIACNYYKHSVGLFRQGT